MTNVVEGACNFYQWLVSYFSYFCGFFLSDFFQMIRIWGRQVVLILPGHIHMLKYWICSTLYYHILCKSLKVTSLRRNMFSTNCCSKTILLQRLVAMQLSLKILRTKQAYSGCSSRPTENCPQRDENCTEWNRRLAEKDSISKQQTLGNDW